MSELYQAILLDELKHPQNRGQLADADVVVNATNAACGDDMTVYLKIDENGAVADIRWEGQGCAISQATMSLLSEEIKGKAPEEIFDIDQHQLELLIGVEEISLGRVKCLMLGLHTVKQSLNSYKEMK